MKTFNKMTAGQNISADEDRNVNVNKDLTNAVLECDDEVKSTHDDICADFSCVVHSLMLSVAQLVRGASVKVAIPITRIQLPEARIAIQLFSLIQLILIMTIMVDMMIFHYDSDISSRFSFLCATNTVLTFFSLICLYTFGMK